MVAVMATVSIAIIVGSLRLGAVQQSVELNTARLDRLEASEHGRIADVARLRAEQESNDHRLNSVEMTRPTTGELKGTTESMTARIEGLEYRLRALEAAPRAPPPK
jgi:hypothetical protein